MVAVASCCCSSALSWSGRVSNPKQASSVLVYALSAAGLLCCILFVVLVVKEKQGKPMFVTMPDDKDVQINKA